MQVQGDNPHQTDSGDADDFQGALVNCVVYDCMLNCLAIGGGQYLYSLHTLVCRKSVGTLQQHG